MSLKNSILLTPEEYNEQAQHINLKSIIENGFHILEAPIKLYTNPTDIVLLTETPSKLYRGGNASAPRLDNARVPKDIEVFYAQEIDMAYLIKIEAFISSLSIISNLKIQTEWVYKYGRNLWLEEGSGGVSTFDSLKGKKNWYACEANQSIPDELVIINDRPGHYLWSPKIDMPLALYLILLKKSESLFAKIN
jgi:hypothetical protein